MGADQAADAGRGQGNFRGTEAQISGRIPDRSVAEYEADAKVLYEFLRQLGGEKLVGAGNELAPGTFWKAH